MQILIICFFTFSSRNYYNFTSQNFITKNIELQKNFFLDNKVYKVEIENQLKINNQKTFNSSNKKILVMGDSYGAEFFLILKKNSDINLTSDIFYYPQSLECFNSFFANDVYCPSLKKIEKEIQIKKPNIVILAVRWSEQDLKYLYKILEFFKKNKIKTVLVSKKIEFLTDGPLTILDSYIVKHKKMPFFPNELIFLKQDYYNKQYGSNKKINLKIKNIGELYNSPIVYLDQCNPELKECIFLDDQSNKIYYDRGHFTLSGIEYFSKKKEIFFFLN